MEITDVSFGLGLTGCCSFQKAPPMKGRADRFTEQEMEPEEKECPEKAALDTQG